MIGSEIEGSVKPGGRCNHKSSLRGLTGPHKPHRPSQALTGLTGLTGLHRLSGRSTRVNTAKGYTTSPTASSTHACKKHLMLTLANIKC